MQDKRHLVLIGFMGTGKSLIGRLLGERSHLMVTDTDHEVEREAGMTIPEIFQQEGEKGFRLREQRVLEQLLKRPPQIITTGGGIVLNHENVRLLKEKGWVVALDASEEELIRRLSWDRSRPLLTGNVTEKVQRLKKERQGFYDFAHFKQDTTHSSPQKTAERIWQEWKALSPPQK
ncbi:shikimate kinase [Marininema mesophilum]|uniref:Shikimate kinase n=1 Tax=Marininema mesophilum TaxID=1048340 RepID=A0A1H2QPJ6_9BACL|nr:shikimate kinase [Marininema mesophilum]SDW08828.1 shikimate kinase [Marininema mesophilum]